jgi:transposase-like protein
MPNYAPELVASVGHQYLHTDKTIEQIARDHGVSSRDVNRMREREGWPTRRDRIRSVPRATQVLQEAEALQAAPAPAAPSTIERIERLVELELAAEETARAQLGRSPRNPADAARCARTLATLTQTVQTLQRLRGGAAPDRGPTDHADFDMPADIDEFRHALARRIELFVAGWTPESESRPSQPAGGPSGDV